MNHLCAYYESLWLAAKTRDSDKPENKGFPLSGGRSGIAIVKTKNMFVVIPAPLFTTVRTCILYFYSSVNHLLLGAPGPSCAMLACSTSSRLSRWLEIPLQWLPTGAAALWEARCLLFHELIGILWLRARRHASTGSIVSPTAGQPGPSNKPWASYFIFKKRKLIEMFACFCLPI